MREMSKQEAERMLSSALVGRLGLCAGDEPYVVPLAFCYMDGKIYTHGAKTGKRVDYVKRNPRVCFEVDEYDPDGFWRSVIVFGDGRLSDGTEMKLKALRGLAQKYSGNTKAEKLRRDSVEEMDLYICEIEVDQITGRKSAPSHE